MFNTPPVFAVYASMLTLRWLKGIGGLDTIEKINNQKAELVYNEIDQNPLFSGTAEVEDRSTMNATFRLNNEELNKRLVSVFGIGPWSVNMFEIFCLGRLDIFSSKDAGLRLAMNNSKMVQPDSDWIKYDEYAKKWSPYRTIAALHLWKTVD